MSLVAHVDTSPATDGKAAIRVLVKDRFKKNKNNLEEAIKRILKKAEYKVTSKEDDKMKKDLKNTIKKDHLIDNSKDPCFTFLVDILTALND